MNHFKKSERSGGAYSEDKEKQYKNVDLTVFVKNQFKQLERRNLRIPVQLFQL